MFTIPPVLENGNSTSTGQIPPPADERVDMPLQQPRANMRHAGATVCVCAFDAGEKNMQRVLFTITASYNGWQVRDELRNRDWFEQLEDAVASASTLAQARYQLTGNSTGVLVEVGQGDTVMRVRHG